MQKSAADDKQIGGQHYKKLDPEPWNVILQWNLGYLEGTALKYIARWRDKGGINDIKKAIHFLEKLVEVEEQKPKSPTELWYNNPLNICPQYHWDIDEVVKQWVARNEAEKVINEDLSQR
jgi:hypothetical protein